MWTNRELECKLSYARQSKCGSGVHVADFWTKSYMASLGAQQTGPLVDKPCNCSPKD